MTFPSLLRGLTHGSASTLYKSRPSAARTRATRCRPSFERLEDRNLMAYDFGLAFGLGSTGSDSAQAVATDASGNVLVTGSFTSASLDLDPGPGTYLLSNAGGYDGYAAKYAPTGNLLWGVHFASTANNQAWKVAVDGADNVLIAGSFSGPLEIGAPGQPHVTLTSGGSNEGFIAKIDSAGNALWARTFGAAADPRFGTITADAAGNVYATGYEGHRLFVAKYGADGAAAWTQVVSAGTGKVYPSLATAFAQGTGLAVDASQNVYVTGRYLGKIDFNPDPNKTNTLSSVSFRGSDPTQDAFVLKLNASGAYVWAGSMGGPSDDGGSAVAVDGAGNVHLSGSYGTGANDFDPGPGNLNLPGSGGYVVKLDPKGNLLWGRGGVGSRGMALDAAGNVYTTGQFSGTIDADPGPGTFNLTAGGTSDVLVSKLNSSGSFVWAADILRGGPGSNGSSSGIAVDGSGNVYTTGYFRGTDDFDPGAGTSFLTSTPDSTGNPSMDAFVSKLVPSSTAFAAAMAVPQSSPMVTVSGTQAVNSSVTISSTEDVRCQAERTEAADQAIAGLFGSEPRRRFSASPTLDFDADLFADIALNVK